jgi:hypothetical protein
MVPRYDNAIRLAFGETLIVPGIGIKNGLHLMTSHGGNGLLPSCSTKLNASTFHSENGWLFPTMTGYGTTAWLLVFSIGRHLKCGHRIFGAGEQLVQILSTA